MTFKAKQKNAGNKYLMFCNYLACFCLRIKFLLGIIYEIISLRIY